MLGPVGAYQATIAPGEPWHFPRSDSDDSAAREDFKLAALVECLGSPARPLDESSVKAVERALVDTRWTDDDVLASLTFSWEERQVIVEADAVTRLARHATTQKFSPLRSAGEPSGEVVVDVRCLQDPAYRDGGIGSHGRMVIAAAPRSP